MNKVPSEEFQETGESKYKSVSSEHEVNYKDDHSQDGRYFITSLKSVIFFHLHLISNKKSETLLCK